ncbi:hypothetical protein O4J56_02225 [Nocardiopsis sp. RSe5-2]|uniref:DUF559 domain-containing protein n=1 Tax=Nocardiopsis endophytica TaxID=3018445 RepID=A0ABT4TXM1_9ACTN|nr:hypothetical protein [Nocardiopsis endophytica]MDA2809443.1 hypothetical protein [Nocardiopsis endophytica]
MGSGIYTHASTQPESLRTALRALALVLPPGAVVGGSAAAALHGADYRRDGDPVAVIAPRDAQVHPIRIRDLPVRVAHAELLGEDTTLVFGIPATAPLRTAFDLSRLKAPDRWEPSPGDLRENVAALNAMLSVGREGRRTRGAPFSPEEFRAYVARERFYRWRGVRRAAAAAEFAHPEVDSPEESRLLMDLVGAGLPVPELQYEIAIGTGGTRRARLDLCYAFDEGRTLVAIEYDGDVHKERRHEDVERWQLIRDQGVRLYIVTSKTRPTVLPSAIADVKTQLRLRGAVVSDHHPRHAARLQRETAERLRHIREAAGSASPPRRAAERRLPYTY